MPRGRRSAPAIGLLVALAAAGASHAQVAPRPGPGPPNLIVVLADDMGDDLGRGFTPQLDRLAAAGRRFESFYATSACTATRASLLTGRHPSRLALPGMSEARPALPAGAPGLAADETTLAETLRGVGYASAAIGKWHLGDQPGSLPLDQGFDVFFGLLYSNDYGRRAQSPGAPAWTAYDLALWRGRDVIERPADQTTLTARYTAEAIRFIRANRERPFFVYLAYAAPHQPLFVPYQEAVRELDAGVGEIAAVLRETGLSERSLIVFLSDNGPYPRGGATAGRRGHKGTTWDGGVRVPAVFSWPGTIEPGSARAPASVEDVAPTLAAQAGARLPRADGRDLSGLLLRGEALPDRPILYHHGPAVDAIRLGRWKLCLRTRAPSGAAIEPERPLLFDLDSDPGEQRDVAERHPEVTSELRERLQAELALPAAR